MKIGVFTYNFPHQKSNEGLIYLRTQGIKIECILAQGWKKLNIPESPMRITPRGLNYPHPSYMEPDTFKSIRIGRWNPLTLNTPHETYYADFSVSPFYASDSLITVTLGSPPLIGYWIYNTGTKFAPQGDDINVTTSGDWLILVSEADTGIFYTEIENAEWALDPGDTNSQGEPNKTADLWKVSWDDSIPSGASISYYVATSDNQEDLTYPDSISWTLVSASEDDPDLQGIYQRGKIILRPSGGNGPIIYEFRGDYVVQDKSIFNWLKALRHGKSYEATEQPARW